jgi:hypothetical protein
VDVIRRDLLLSSAYHDYHMTNCTSPVHLQPQAHISKKISVNRPCCSRYLCFSVQLVRHFAGHPAVFRTFLGHNWH